MGRTWAEVRALAAMQRHKPYTVQTRHRHRSWYNNNSQRRRASRIFKTLPQAGTTDCLAVRQETGGREPTGLGDMPPELVDAIGGYLVHPRDLASARMASRLFCQISFEVTAVAWGVGHLPRLVAAGAPPYLVAASIVLRAQALGLGMLACAVRGGHDTVVRLILNLIEA
ncbi:hypothetical protein pmac_cds_593 [Pandoravirus macleodensis]|uniref:F-box domain-containing protein n=1 Tax=Pandoravirus macleodensis TaxID=2107707 RepID=A0A2U7UGX6_9VIRU|nr:hypothetical protein pmac_cds_593 [Pandoravirus macleodensis]AVK77281.1 hypothetical protein pmac_cds_593 [Pandoravirus macleodensis]